jgi:hypothetical protein
MRRDPPALHVVVPLAPAAEAASEVLDLDTLFRRYASYVAAIAHRLLGRDDDVDDTVQEVFLAAIRGLHKGSESVARVHRGARVAEAAPEASRALVLRAR